MALVLSLHAPSLSRRGGPSELVYIDEHCAKSRPESNNRFCFLLLLLLHAVVVPIFLLGLAFAYPLCRPIDLGYSPTPLTALLTAGRRRYFLLVIKTTDFEVAGVSSSLAVRPRFFVLHWLHIFVRLLPFVFVVFLIPGRNLLPVFVFLCSTAAAAVVVPIFLYGLTFAVLFVPATLISGTRNSICFPL